MGKQGPPDGEADGWTDPEPLGDAGVGGNGNGGKSNGRSGHGGALPFTGGQHLGLKLFAGGGLILLGLFLLLAGRRTRRT
ncbi:MAG: hypothetical protein H7233_06030 [Pseudorhodobacter sp.]|nr:hypothetical protein [Frankiaceae bacterium]